MLPATRGAARAQARAGLRPFHRRPMPVCPVTVLPYLTREGGKIPPGEIIPEAALAEQGHPSPDRGVTEAFPPDPARS